MPNPGKQQPNFRPFPLSSGENAWIVTSSTDRESLVTYLRQSVTTSTTAVTGQHVYQLPIMHPDRCFLVMADARFGVQGFLVEVEMTLFPPSTDRNNHFLMTALDWQEMDWIIIHFPGHHREAVEAIAERWKLRFRENGAVPHVIERVNGQKKAESFPLAALPNVYTLESMPDASAYLNLEFIRVNSRLRIAWANSLPLHSVRVLDLDDPAANGRHTCAVCQKLLRVGDTVALIGDDPARALATDVCIEHIDRAKKPVGQGVA